MPAAWGLAPLASLRFDHCYKNDPRMVIFATSPNWHHPILFPLPIPLPSGLSRAGPRPRLLAKQLLMNLGGYGCQASPGRIGCFYCRGRSNCIWTGVHLQ